MERTLAFFVGLVLVCDLVVVGVHALDDRTSLIRRKPQTADTPSPQLSVVPRPGQAFLSGRADRVTADNAQSAPIPTPFTVTAAEAGAGRVTIDRAIVGGRRVTISWDGGTPLPVSGDGSLDFGAGHVEVDGGGPVYSLDEASRRFAPGSYSLGTAVAVGTGGLSTPREGVSFSADEQTALSARGRVVVRLTPRALELRGPGSLLLTGKLAVQTSDRRSSGTTVRFGEGPFELRIEPGGGGTAVSGLLQGSVDVS